ncbi:MAG: YceI family protein [Candidatus Bipolaricaulia bacterium]
MSSQRHRIRFAMVAVILTLMVAFPMVDVAQEEGTEAENGENGDRAIVDLVQRLTFELIPEESEIRFAGTVPIAPNFSGRAERFEGTIGGHPPNLEADAFAEIVIEAVSLNTGLGLRDRDMRRALEAETYPQIRFSMKPGNLEHLGERPVEIRTDALYRSRVVGVIELHGVQQEITMEVEWELSGDRLHISGETSLLLSDYGIDRPRPPLLPVRVDDEIQVSFSITGKLIED